jgi:NAD(P)-dependent dehydrogenase (short-subunit alcohol dehydrogenase family)
MKVMQKSAFVTGADRGLGLALCAGLLRSGWSVFAGQFMPEWMELANLSGNYSDDLHLVPLDVGSIESAKRAAEIVGKQTQKLDLLINNAGVISPSMYANIREGQDYAEIQRLIDINALGPLRVVEAFLPLTEQSDLKRLCFVSSEAGSITNCQRTAWFGYCMSKTAVNMGVKILFNHLRPEGYTFRLYHPGWIRSYMSGKKNLEATFEPQEAAEMALSFFLGERDEDQLALVDFEGQEWPW